MRPSKALAMRRMLVLNLAITNHALSYRQTSVVLSQRSRTVSDMADLGIGKAPILSNHAFELDCEGFLDLFATRSREPSFSGTELAKYPAGADLPLI